MRFILNPATQCVAALCLLTFMLTGCPEPPPTKVSVPNLIGLPLAAAEQVISGIGLVLGNTTETSSDNVSIGSVASQTPVAGNTIALGSQIDLVISTGPGLVTVPNIVGQERAEAEKTLVAAGLLAGSVTETTHPQFPVNSVVSQSTDAGVLVARGMSISFVITKGTIVPDLIGESLVELLNTIENAGVQVGSVEEVLDSTSNNTILSSDPLPSEVVAPGTKINLVVSSGTDAMVVWKKQTNARLQSITATPDGGYVGASQIGSDAAIIKLNALAEVEWQALYGGPNFESGFDVQPTSDGYILVGSTSSYGGGNDDALLVKTDLAGNQVFLRAFGGIGFEAARSVVVDQDGGYFFIGTVSEDRNHDSTYYAVKTTNDGQEDWSIVRDIECDGGESCNVVIAKAIQTAQDEFTFAYSSCTPGCGGSFYGAASRITAGQPEWSVATTEMRVGIVSDIKQAINGIYVLGAQTEIDLLRPPLQRDWESQLVIAKLDDDGNSEWIQNLGSAESNYPGTIELTEGGGCIITGSDGDFMYVAKLDDSGNEEWSRLIYTEQFNRRPLPAVMSVLTTSGLLLYSHDSFTFLEIL